MTSSELASYGEAGATLERVLATGRISPSYLFEGADAAAARDAALAFAAALLGGDVDGAQGARVRRLVAALDHPDLHMLEKDKATVISVAALTAQLEQAYQKPLEGDRQVFVIDPADAMEAEGIARYLKALEEPPPGTVYILVSTHPDRLPATVLSRVRRVRLPPLSEAAIVERLRSDGVDTEPAEHAAHWGTGSLARARRIATYGLEAVAARLARATQDDGGATRAADAALQAIERASAERAEAEGDGAADRRRQGVRDLLADVIHIFAVEARDLAAGRVPMLLAAGSSAHGVALLERLGPLSAAVASNVTPSIVVLELARILRPVT